MTIAISRLKLLAVATALVGWLAASPIALAQDSVRAEIGKPLQSADALFKQKNYKAALEKVAEAEAVPNRTAFENLTIQRTRGSIASAAGEFAVAAKAFEAVIASGRVTGAEQLKLVQAVGGLYYQAKDYPKAAQWAERYLKEGGTDPGMRTVLVQAHFLNNDCAAVSKIVGDGSDAARKPTEQELQILANCFLKRNDTAGYVAAIERLVVLYPKKEYWTDLLNRVQKKPGFSARMGIDVYRLKMATGNVASTNDYFEMAQLALQAGYPSEAKSIIDKGFAAGALGKDKEADRHKRLRDLALKQLDESKQARAQAEKDAVSEKTGDALVAIGYRYVSEGAADKGLPLMEQGIKKGGLKRPEDAKLLLGYAQYQAGQRAKAAQTLKGVQGNDGPADLARLWTLLAQRG